MVTIPVLDIENGTKAKKSQSNGSSNGSGNGHKNLDKNGSYDNDVVIIEDEGFPVVRHEEKVATSAEESIPLLQFSPTKKKRSRRSKDSTESKESKDSDLLKKTDEAAKPQSPVKLQEDVIMHVDDQPVVEETSAASETKELKIVKLTSEGLTGSKRRSDRLQNASTIVNLSTVSTSDSTKNIDDETFEASVVERRVSGRRSTRPIDDIKFSCRYQNNDSMNTTTNATIGSDVNNDSLLTTPGTDRKRRALHESMENSDSPKKSRLNLSGLFNSFSSPVSILRNRFKRTNIASTPILGGSEALMHETVESLDTSGGDQFIEVDLDEKEELESGDKEELKVTTTPIKKTSCNVM